MRVVLYGLVICVGLLAAGAVGQAAHAMSAQIQALETSIDEARKMGLDPAMIHQMEQMLAAAKADMARRGVSPDDGPQMEPNHYDVIGARSYSDCDQYSDTQAFGFCQAATHYYLMYTEIFAKEGDTPAARQVYAGHVDTVENLVQYVDHHMTAPRNY